MKLYHGTTFSSSKIIEKDKKLSCSAPRFYSDDHMFPSQKGYIYLTNNPGLAFYYGNKHSVFSKPQESLYTVYVIEIKENLLQIDSDELKYVFRLNSQEIKNISFHDSLIKTQTCRVNFDLLFGEHVKKKITLPTSMNFEDNYKLTSTIINLREKVNFKEVLSITEKLDWIHLE